MDEFLSSQYFENKIVYEINDFKDFKKHYYYYLIEHKFLEVKKNGFQKIKEKDWKIKVVKEFKKRNKVRGKILKKIKEMGELNMEGIYFSGEKSILDPFKLCLNTKKNINKELINCGYF